MKGLSEAKDIKKKYAGYPLLDLGKFIFACLIPLLHIPFGDSRVLFLLQQYVSRLGVPFFFAVSGFFLCQSVAKRGRLSAYTRYSKRIARLLLVWMVVYSPVFYLQLKSNSITWRHIIFLTPGYLWYLVALLVAAVPFCFIKNRKVLYICGGILYIMGTLLGGSYSWLTGGWPAYEAIFISTRNGVFFGLPLLCLGEIILRETSSKGIFTRKRNWIGLLCSVIMLLAEITFVQKHARGEDCSLYLLMPVFIYFFGKILLQGGIHISQECSEYLRGTSTAIYVMQYGIILVGTRALALFITNQMLIGIMTLLMVIICPCILYYVLSKFKLRQVIF